MDYLFTCKTHPQHHSGPHSRSRSATSTGTKNLLNGMRQCFSRQGVSQAPTSGPPVLEYTASNHRALIAIRCAKNSRPINEILDEEYRQEVQMLRPGAVVPHPTTVASDLLHLYMDLSLFVVSYFAVCNLFFFSDQFLISLIRNSHSAYTLHLMDGHHLLLLHILVWLLSGMIMVHFIGLFLSLSGKVSCIS